MTDNFDIHEWNKNRYIHNTISEGIDDLSQSLEKQIKSIAPDASINMGVYKENGMGYGKVEVINNEDLDQQSFDNIVNILKDNGLSVDLQQSSKYYDYDDGRKYFPRIAFDFSPESIQEMEMGAEDRTDVITMDVPLFIRILEYSREDAKDDMDLHDLTENAIEGTKQQGILSMDDYEMLIDSVEITEETGYSPQMVTPENPRGETKGLDSETMNKILMKLVQDIDESKSGLWSNIHAKRERGEKPSHGNSKAHKSAVKAGRKINKDK